MAIVRILPTEEGNLNTKMVTVDVNRNGTVERLVISYARDLTLKIDDSIRCVAGSAVAMINPGTQAGAYILTINPPFGKSDKYVTTLSITPKTLAEIGRGQITSVEDIGTKLTATAAATR